MPKSTNGHTARLSTNLILRPDVVHSISFSWNFVTKTHKAQPVFGRHVEVVLVTVTLVVWNLTCSPSAVGWRSSLVCKHSRCPPLYIRAQRPPPALPGWSPLCQYHLWSSNASKNLNTDVWIPFNKSSTNLVLHSTNTTDLFPKETCILTHFHLLGSTLSVPCIILRSTIVLACVFFPDWNELLCETKDKPLLNANSLSEAHSLFLCRRFILINIIDKYRWVELCTGSCYRGKQL